MAHTVAVTSAEVITSEVITPEVITAEVIKRTSRRPASCTAVDVAREGFRSR